MFLTCGFLLAAMLFIMSADGLTLRYYTSFPPPADIPSGTTQLNMDDNSFPTIPSGGLNNVIGSLTHLYVSRCGMTSVGDIAPVGATLLQLYLHNNPFVILSNQTFDGLVALTHLDISYCSLTALPDMTAFANTLQHLYINNNPLNDIPSQKTACLTTLIQLYAWSIELTEFPDLSGSYATLLDLHLHSNNIEKLSDNEMGSFLVLHYLHFDSNKLTSLSNITSPALETLHANNNPLMFGPDLPLTVSIKTFSFSGANEAEFPDMQTRESLVTLTIPYITFTEVPSERLILLTGLQQLDITSQPNILPNKTIEFPGNDVVTLLRISILSSKIVVFPDFNYLCESLTYIDLQANYIAYIPAKRLLAVQKLSILYLQNNDLTVMPFSGHLDNILAVFSLRRNEITEIKGIHRNVVNTDLSYNHISKISTLDTEMFTQTSLLYLYSNPTLTHISDPYGNSPHNFQTDIRGSLVDPCSCENLWMRIANDASNNKVYLSDRICGGIEELNWSQYNNTELLKYCTTDNLRGKNWKEKKKSSEIDTIM